MIARNYIILDNTPNYLEEFTIMINSPQGSVTINHLTVMMSLITTESIGSGTIDLRSSFSMWYFSQLIPSASVSSVKQGMFPLGHTMLRSFIKTVNLRKER